MKKAIIFAGAALLAATVGASAQMAGAFYLVRDSAAKKCMVVDNSRLVRRL